MQPKNGEQGLQRTDYCNNKNIALLTKKERNWLLGNISLNLSKSYEYKLKSTIKKKIQTFVDFELPLLTKNNFIISSEPESLGTGLGDRSNYDNSSLGKAKVPGPNPGQGLPIIVKARNVDLIDLIPNCLNFNKIVASISFYIMTIRVAWNSL
jgi:hypothetical protein